MPTVLAIDDAQESLISVRIAARGCRLLTATTGEEAMRMIAEHIQSVDAVILDLMLPDIDGAMLCATIRQHHAVVPIIPITGHPEALRKIEHMGVSLPIIKPAESTEIRRVLQEVLGMPLPAVELDASQQAIQQQFDFSTRATNGGGYIANGHIAGVLDYEERPELLSVRGATWEDLDLALVEQLDDCRPAHAQEVAQVLLDEPLAGSEAPAGDGFAQSLDDLAADRGGDRRHAHG